MGDRATGQLDIAEIFSKTADLYWGNFGKLFLLSVVLLLPQQLLAMVGTGSALAIIVYVVTIPLDIVVPVWLAAAIVRLVQDADNDRDENHSIIFLLRTIWPMLWKLSLLAIVTLIPIAFGLGLLIIPGAYLALMWMVVVPAMMVERLGVFNAMSRSSELTNYHRIRMIWIGAVILLVQLLILALGFLITDRLLLAGVDVVAASLMYPYLAIITTVLYFRLRDLKGSKPTPEVL